MKFRLSPYAKTVVAVLFAVVVLAKTYATDSEITSAELVDIAIAALTALGVYSVPNKE